MRTCTRGKCSCAPARWLPHEVHRRSGVLTVLGVDPLTRSRLLWAVGLVMVYVALMSVFSLASAQVYGDPPYYCFGSQGGSNNPHWHEVCIPSEVGGVVLADFVAASDPVRAGLEEFYGALPVLASFMIFGIGFSVGGMVFR